MIRCKLSFSANVLSWLTPILGPRLAASLILILPLVCASAAESAAKIASATFAAAPLVNKNPASGKQWILAEIDSGGLTNLTVTASASGLPEQQPVDLGNLEAGKKSILFEIPTIPVGQKINFVLASPAGRRSFENIALEPPKKWTVYLAQHTHTDIGYTRPQTEILREHLRYIDYALDYCDQTDDYPDDARFRWTCETSWAVREYLKRRPVEQLERLQRRVREGRIEITAMMLNMSEIATESSIASLLQPVRRIKQQLGVPVQTAMQNDVNGAAWCLVDYFSDAGIKYLTMGINRTRSLLPFDKPTAFWWESPSGKRILANRPDHYMTANFWNIHQGNLDHFRQPAIKYLRSLEQRQYPFDSVGVQFSGYFTDNSPPSTAACDLVKEWNERYAWPKLRLTTVSEFLNHLEKSHRDDLQVFRVGWPDWWTDGFGSAARETAASRDTHVDMQITKALFGMAAMLGEPVKPQVAARIADIQDNLLFYDEHTYGAAESISDPLAENAEVQWAEKSAYVWSAVKDANLLREEAFGLLQDRLPRAETPTLAIFNTLNWDRSALVEVFIDHEVLPEEKDYAIVDMQTGKPTPVQRLSKRSEGAYWAIWARDVPSLGYRMLQIKKQDNADGTPKAEQSAAKNLLENNYYRLTIDGTKGAVASLVDKESGKELVDPQNTWGLGGLVYELLPEGRDFKREAFQRSSLKNIKIEPGAAGPIWRSLVIKGDLEGCAPGKASVAIRLFDTEKRVEFHYSIRKLPVTKGEAVYAVFPFQARDWKMQYEAQGGVVIPGENQLPGSSSDWQTIQNFVSLRHADGQIVWVPDQAPLVQLGDFNLGKWMPVTKVDKPHVYSWVMNNYWFTNFRVSQEGDFKWRYALTSAKDSGLVTATRFGWGTRVPLTARVFPGGKSPRPGLPVAQSLVRVNVPNFLMVDLRPAATGAGLIYHLREIAGKKAVINAENTDSVAQVSQLSQVNVLEELLQPDLEEAILQPYESKFFHVIYGP